MKYKAIAVNVDATLPRFLIQLGAYGHTRLLIGAYHEDEALELAAEWCEEHAPGHLYNEEVEEAYREGIAEGLSEEEAQTRAEIDMIPRDCGRYLSAADVYIIMNPTAADVRGD